MKANFYISTSKICDSKRELLNDKYILKILNILDKYNIIYATCDTVEGFYNLNQEFLYFTDIEIDVSYSYARPTAWAGEDIEILEDLINEGKIIVIVYYITKEREHVLRH